VSPFEALGFLGGPIKNRNMKLGRILVLSMSVLGSLTALRCGAALQNRPRKILQPITYQDFLEAEKKDAYYKTRWKYFSIVVDLIQKIQPKSALELGAYSLPLIKGEDTMDIKKYLDDLTYLHDATVVPWPIPDKKYDLFISCEVWEHLGDRQKEAFKEVMRISRRAIFSFPYKWVFPKDSKNPSAASHRDIDEAKIAEWTLYQKPITIIFSEDKRFVVYYFEFRK
jgi:hypothetical protein